MPENSHGCEKIQRLGRLKQVHIIYLKELAAREEPPQFRKTFLSRLRITGAVTRTRIGEHSFGDRSNTRICATRRQSETSYRVRRSRTPSEMSGPQSTPLRVAPVGRDLLGGRHKERSLKVRERLELLCLSAGPGGRQ